MNFHSHFSDDSAENAATTFDNIKKFVHWMYENSLFKKYGIIQHMDVANNTYVIIQCGYYLYQKLRKERK